MGRVLPPGVPAVRIPFRPPLAWEAMLGYFEVRAIPGVEQVSDGRYLRTVRTDAEPCVLELSLGGPDHLVLDAHLPGRDGLTDVAHRARRVFGLDADVEAANRHLGGDPIVGPLLRARPGLRAPGAWDPFETGVRAIVGQQVSVAGASTVTGRIAARLGTPVPGLRVPGLSHLFPSPKALATADLTGLGLTAARAAAIRAFAAAVAGGEVRLEGGRALDRLVASITAVPGLGAWTAHYLALRLGEPDAFPASDLGVRRALAELVGHEVSAREAGAIAERWRPWRAHAAVHLWAGRRSAGGRRRLS